jgi:HlyD family secretion protein
VSSQSRKSLAAAFAALVLAGLVVLAWQRGLLREEDDGIVSGNGRIEAVEIDVAARNAGRISEVLVEEGDFVLVGQLVATLDPDQLEAQRRQAEAELQQADSAVATARSLLAQRESERIAAQATVAQRAAELRSARNQLSRSLGLQEKKFISPQAVDDDRTRAETAQASLDAARAQVAAGAAGVVNAASQVRGAQAAEAAARAQLERVLEDLDDMSLKAPADARVQFRIAEPGEVVPAGGKVLNLIDLSNVYMTFFLPTAAVGRLALGDEVRLILDAAPQWVIPATISFVASEAQFTPKTVETASEREKLMFRVKARIPADLLRKHIRKVKTGLPGMAYVRLDPGTPWPPPLQVKLPQ